MKFDRWQEEHWVQAVIIGFLMVVFLLDVIRSAIITIVELRKYEIRKRSKAGDFVVRKVNKTDDSDSLPALLRPKPKTKAKATAPVPNTAPKFNDMNRPKFLPDVQAQPKMAPGGALPPPPPGMGTPRGSRPGNRTPPNALPYGQPSPAGTPTNGGKYPLQTRPPGSQTPPGARSGSGGYGQGGMPPPPPGGVSPAMSYRSGASGGSRGVPPPPPGAPGKGMGRSSKGK